jgi:hypothetical protein
MKKREREKDKKKESENEREKERERQKQKETFKIQNTYCLLKQVSRLYYVSNNIT